MRKPIFFIVKIKIYYLCQTEKSSHHYFPDFKRVDQYLCQENAGL